MLKSLTTVEKLINEEIVGSENKTPTTDQSNSVPTEVVVKEEVEACFGDMHNFVESAFESRSKPITNKEVVSDKPKINTSLASHQLHGKVLQAYCASLDTVMKDEVSTLCAEEPKFIAKAEVNTRKDVKESVLVKCSLGEKVNTKKGEVNS